MPELGASVPAASVAVASVPERVVREPVVREVPAVREQAAVRAAWRGTRLGQRQPLAGDDDRA